MAQEDNTIGKRIRYLRESHDLTQDQFGALCDASKSAVSQWVRGGTTPSTETLIKLRSKINFSIDWLLGGSDLDCIGDERTRRLIDLYAELDERGKTAVYRVAQSESNYAVNADDLPKRSA